MAPQNAKWLQKDESKSQDAPVVLRDALLLTSMRRSLLSGDSFVIDGHNTALPRLGMTVSKAKVPEIMSVSPLKSLSARAQHTYR